MATAFRFGKHLKELRIHLCQHGESSKGIREFIKNQYVGLKSQNLDFPILIRECSGTEPKLWARYEFGKESSVSLSNLSSEDVFKQLTNLTQK